MISPEQLRRYPFFGRLSETQLIEIAMISDHVSIEAGEIIAKEGDLAEALYFLEEGAVDLYYIPETGSILQEGYPVGTINPGEPFSISAVIEPHILTSTVRASGPCRAIRIQAQALRRLMKNDRQLAYVITHHAAKAVIERLHATRTQLAAARA